MAVVRYVAVESVGQPPRRAQRPLTLDTNTIHYPSDGPLGKPSRISVGSVFVDAGQEVGGMAGGLN